MLRAIRESNGFAIAVDDDAILAARDEIAGAEGLLTCPEGAATYAAYKSALASGRVSVEESVVLFNCAIGVKYELPTVEEHLDCSTAIDYARLRQRQIGGSERSQAAHR
jgi:threonine synthase